ncbi:unnamed protein product [Bursaphelenchus okinawaensis]|uniref:DWNN domain-containing protein n=1 Tax=Bursaphelenchus okinawaensis TaxID=465554 RepID=A0A811JR67_9BILA|nr:unnamed protein product [Bursaphelenchus okinawaensis]CAG9079114.1 unnamed protein product [Bursaphelenchus okinawaensis]
MSTIHYKFHSCVTYTTITFDDLHVRVNELKQKIYEKENLSQDQFDLTVENAHTKRVYNDEHIVPRNSSVIVRRCPKENTKAPKVHDQSTSGIVGKNNVQTAPDLSFIDSIDFSKLTEQERLAHIKKVSAEKYTQQNFRRTTNSSAFSEPPPPSYVCNRCSRTGHWYRECPLVNIKRTTGIPMEELVETTADDPHAMLHPTGKFMVQKMHINARLTSKVKHPLGVSMSPNQESGQSPRVEEDPIPEELQCPMCKELLKEAVLTICCGQSFCMACMMQVIMSDNPRCPGQDCAEREITNNSIVENKQLRRAVEKYRLTKAQPVQKPVNFDSVTGIVPLPQTMSQEVSVEETVESKRVYNTNKAAATPPETNGSSINAISNNLASTNLSSQNKLPTVDLTKYLASTPAQSQSQPVNNASASVPNVTKPKETATKPNLDDTAPPGTFEESNGTIKKAQKNEEAELKSLWETLLQRDEPSLGLEKAKTARNGRERKETSSSNSSEKVKKRTPSPDSEAKNAALLSLLGGNDDKKSSLSALSALDGLRVIDPVTGKPILSNASKTPKKRSSSRRKSKDDRDRKRHKEDKEYKKNKEDRDRKRSKEDREHRRKKDDRDHKRDKEDRDEKMNKEDRDEETIKEDRDGQRNMEDRDEEVNKEDRDQKRNKDDRDEERNKEGRDEEVNKEDRDQKRNKDDRDEERNKEGRDDEMNEEDRYEETIKEDRDVENMEIDLDDENMEEEEHKEIKEDKEHKKIKEEKEHKKNKEEKEHKRNKEVKKSKEEREEKDRKKSKDREEKEHKKSKEDRENKKKRKREKEEKSESHKRKRSKSGSDDEEVVKKKKKKHKKKDR